MFSWNGLQKVTLRGDNIEGFQNSWVMVLTGLVVQGPRPGRARVLLLPADQGLQAAVGGHCPLQPRGVGIQGSGQRIPVGHS